MPKASPHTKQKLVVLPEYCTRAAGSDCARCERCCPKEAIQLEGAHKAPVVEHSLCNGCGICFGVCDSFASTRMSLFDLHARIRRIAENGQRAYLTCNENVFPGLEVDTNVVVVPCLSMLSPELWTLMLAEGIRITLACDLKYCEDCERGGEVGASLFSRAVQIAEERTGEKVLFTFRIPEKKSLLGKYADNETNDRREVFAGFASDAASIASGKRRLRNSEVLRDYYERRERQRAAMRLHLASVSPHAGFGPEGRRKKLLFPKQGMVVEAAECSPRAAERTAVGVSLTDAKLCVAAGSCVRACPTGARYVEGGSAHVEAQLCVACGICVDVCEQGACSIEEATAEIYLSQDMQG